MDDLADRPAAGAVRRLELRIGEAGDELPQRGLRALAVLSVIAFHAGLNVTPGGFVGVDVFFVISGFLITSIICRNLESGTFSFLDFYARRSKRIFPALISR